MLPINEGDPMLIVGSVTTGTSLGTCLTIPSSQGEVCLSESPLTTSSFCPFTAVLGMAGGGCLRWLLWWGPPSAQPHTSSWWLCTTLRICSRLLRRLQTWELQLSGSVNCDATNLLSLCKITKSEPTCKTFSVLICQTPGRFCLPSFA